MPDFSSLLSDFVAEHQLTIGVILAILLVAAWIAFKIIKRTIMLALFVLVALVAVGGTGAYLWWPS